jgi:hypothetical protein
VDLDGHKIQWIVGVWPQQFGGGVGMTSTPLLMGETALRRESAAFCRNIAALVQNLYVVDWVDLRLCQPLLSTTWQARHRKALWTTRLTGLHVVRSPISSDL